MKGGLSPFRVAGSNLPDSRFFVNAKMYLSTDILHFWYFLCGGVLLFLFVREARIFLIKRYEFRFYEMQFHDPEREIVSMPQAGEVGINAAD